MAEFIADTGTLDVGANVETLEFHRQGHIKYLKSVLNVLPEPYQSIDPSRLTALYFAVVGLDILGKVDSLDKTAIVEFLYSLQLLAPSDGTKASHGGFVGGNFTNHSVCGLCNDDKDHAQNATGEISNANTHATCESCPLVHMHTEYHQGHIAMTYTALMSLVTLGDDLSRVDRSSILSGLKALQMPSGAYRATLSVTGEADVRFLYCACAISSVLKDWSAVNIPLAVQYIVRCFTYEGGIAVMPDCEATGGSCYCAVASLVLMNRLDELSAETIKDLIRWCEARQVNGYQGRTNKDPDSCYSFWVGATLQLLRSFDTTDIPSTQTFLLRDCQQGKYSGGFSKLPDTYSDVLHTFYSLCWLSMAEYGGLRSIDARLGICSDHCECLNL